MVLFLLVLSWPGSVLAESITCTQPATLNSSPPEEDKIALLDEVVVPSREFTTRSSALGAWLKRLEGQYRYEGHVDLCGDGNTSDRQLVTGSSDCVSLYNGNDEARRSLYCVMNVRWPQVQNNTGAHVVSGESHLSPAVITYGVVPDLPGIQFMQLDSKGIATHAQGRLTGDTLTTIESCGLPGFCRKVTRITARQDRQDISMLIDVEIDSRPVLRHVFLMHRVSNTQMRRTQHDALTREDLLMVGE